jgi:hypothetical protein
MLSGYPPEDLLLRPGLHAGLREALHQLAATWRTVRACMWWWATRIQLGRPGRC